MVARLVTLMLVITLALPYAALTPATDSLQSPWKEGTVAAKGKKHKKKNQRHRTVTRTERQTVMQIFTSAVPFAIGSDGYAETAAAPYPGTIAVSGFTNGTITDVDLILTDLTHEYPDDLDVLLSASTGRRAFVMSDVGTLHQVTNLDLVLDDEAASALPDEAQLSGGRFRPTIFGTSGSDVDEVFPAPAPTHDSTVALSTFDGVNPNGTWQLWVMDDSSSDIGDLEGWALQITAEVDVSVEKPAKAKNRKQNKKGKHGKRR